MLKVNAARPECPRKHVDDWLRGALGKPWNRQKRFPKLLFLLYVTGSLAAVFYLPYQFPTSPSTSESWIFGYNNRAGEILVLVTVLLESTKTNDRIFAAVLTVICTAFMFLFSPETPIALSFAGVCLYILSVPKWTRQLSAILASEVFILCALFWSVFHTPVYDTIKTDSAGANSFPIVLSPPILFFLATVFFAGCYVYRRLEQQSLNDDCFALVVYSIPMLAAALGRCDPGHLASNGQGLILVSMFSISVFEVPWRRYRVVYVVFMFLLPSLTGLAIFANQLGQVSSLNAADADPNMRTDLLEKTFPTWTGKFMVPFGFRPNGIGTYLSARN